jgi:hypothetical protein
MSPRLLRLYINAWIDCIPRPDFTPRAGEEIGGFTFSRPRSKKSPIEVLLMAIICRRQCLPGAWVPRVKGGPVYTEVRCSPCTLPSLRVNLNLRGKNPLVLCRYTPTVKPQKPTPSEFAVGDEKAVHREGWR